MGYTTYFDGAVTIDPPLNAKEVEYINKFNETRRMDRKNGPYYVGGTGDYGQGHDDDILEYNKPHASQPNLWCNWRVADDGTVIEWDCGEKFYNAGEWMEYLINHFLSKDPIAKRANRNFDFLDGHLCNGVIMAEGEEFDDRWMIEVVNNVVTVKDGTVTVTYE